MGERWGSNPRPPEPQSGALPTELRPPNSHSLQIYPSNGQCKNQFTHAIFKT